MTKQIEELRKADAHLQQASAALTAAAQALDATRRRVLDTLATLVQPKPTDDNADHKLADDIDIDIDIDSIDADLLDSRPNVLTLDDEDVVAAKSVDLRDQKTLRKHMLRAQEHTCVRHLQRACACLQCQQRHPRYPRG